jgi:hypothetical protein
MPLLAAFFVCWRHESIFHAFNGGSKQKMEAALLRHH